MSAILRFGRNDYGRDYIVGDIHGSFSKLAEHLRNIGFDASSGDRLFSVGDLVDRGEECEVALAWIKFPWFFAVAGNHEDFAIRWPSGNMDPLNYIRNGGAWNVAKSLDESLVFANAFADLPIAIELETSSGLVGIVHADCPKESWSEFAVELESAELSNSNRKKLIEHAQWSRRRLELRKIGFESGDVIGVRAVVVGHTPLPSPEWVGNVLHIDTGGWHPNGHGFTVIDAETLAPARCVARDVEMQA